MNIELMESMETFLLAGAGQPASVSRVQSLHSFASVVYLIVPSSDADIFYRVPTSWYCSTGFFF